MISFAHFRPCFSVLRASIDIKCVGYH